MAYYQPYQNQYYTQMAQAYPPAQQTPVQQNSNSLIWVQGEQAAKSYMVAPNTTVLLMDSDASRFYLKSSDASGMPMLRVFEYSEIAQNAPNKAQDGKVIDYSSFATKAEFDAFRAEIEGILKNVPKQTTRRSREVEDDG